MTRAQGRGHAGAWLAWYLAALLIASGSVHPLVTVGVLGAACAIVLTHVPPGERGPFRIVLLLGGCFIAIRVLLFTLTGRAGATPLLHLPELRLPGLLGGLRIGGTLSAEVAVHELAEGFRLCAILAATGAFAAVTDVADLVRLAPRRLRRAGVVLQIAVAFLPALAASAREVREAQRMRGVRVRGLRSAVPVIVPVLAGALERAFLLAESLHTRGFDRAQPTRLRHRSLTGVDRLAGAAACVAGVIGILAARTAAGSWSAYPMLSWPAADPLLLVAPLLLLAPAVLAPVPSATPITEAA